MVGTCLSRVWRAALLLAITIAAVGPAAASAQSSEESSGAGGVPVAPAVVTAQQREESRAQRIKEREEIHAVRSSERQRRQEERELKSGSRVTPRGFVEISCAGVTWHFRNFPAGEHTITEIITIDGTHQKRNLFTFVGESATNTTYVEGTISATRHKIDARARWTNPAGSTAQHGWDIISTRTCAPPPPPKEETVPAFAVEKRQQIEGPRSRWVPGPVVGEVGQTVLYEIVVTNIGNVALTFNEGFSDPGCDPGTIGVESKRPLEPKETRIFTCKHVLTLADLLVGSYLNVAVVTGTPVGGGAPISHRTNTVIVELTSPHEEHGGGGGGTGGPGGPGGGQSPGNQPSGSQTAGQTNSGSGSFGVLASSQSSATAAAVPSLTGAPRACVRSSFVVSVSTHGVHSVTFYLDGHRLRTFTVRTASHSKRISIRISVAHLKVGVHTLKAKITMVATTASHKPRVASRSVRFVRCASAASSPRFTG
jgi:hypothetical protein